MHRRFLFIMMLGIFSVFTSCTSRGQVDDAIVIPHITKARLMHQADSDPSITVNKFDCPKAQNHAAIRMTACKFVAKGFQPGDRYSGYRYNAMYQSMYFGEFVVDKDGDLFWLEAKCKFGENEKYSMGFLNGEQTYYVFVSKDEKQVIAVVETPDPIEFTWDDGAYISLSLYDMPKWEFLLAGKNFVPGEIISLTIVMNNETHTKSLEADSNGMISWVLPQAPTSASNETASLTLSRRGLKPIVLTYLFGRAALMKAMPKKYPTRESVSEANLNEVSPPYMFVTQH